MIIKLSYRMRKMKSIKGWVEMKKGRIGVIYMNMISKDDDLSVKCRVKKIIIGIMVCMLLLKDFLESDLIQGILVFIFLFFIIIRLLGLVSTIRARWRKYDWRWVISNMVKIYIEVIYVLSDLWRSILINRNILFILLLGIIWLIGYEEKSEKIKRICDWFERELGLIKMLIFFIIVSIMYRGHEDEIYYNSGLIYMLIIVLWKGLRMLKVIIENRGKDKGILKIYIKLLKISDIIFGYILWDNLREFIMDVVNCEGGEDKGKGRKKGESSEKSGKGFKPRDLVPDWTDIIIWDWMEEG